MKFLHDCFCVLLLILIRVCREILSHLIQDVFLWQLYPTADMVGFSESATKYAGFNVCSSLCTCYWLCPLEMRGLCLKRALPPIVLCVSKLGFGMGICFNIVSCSF